MKRALVGGLWILSCGLVVAACSDDGKTNDAANPVEVPAFSELPSLYAAAFCDAQRSCLGDDLLESFLATDDCEAILEQQFTNAFFWDLEDARSSGTVVYDSDQVAACLDEVRAGGCELGYSTVCEAALGGTVPEGGDCTHDAECQGDRFCQVTGACPGQCSARLAAGENCRSDDDCARSAACFDGRCVTRPGDGAECEDGGVGCAAGRFCLGADSDAGMPGTCRSLEDVRTAAEGADCDLGTVLCEEGSFCALTGVDLVAATPIFQCVAAATATGPCHLAAPSQCPVGTHCEGVDWAASQFEGTCKLLPVDGELCAETFSAACAAEHACVDEDSDAATPGVCRRLLANAGTCAFDDECFSGNCIGSRCVPDSPCAG